MLVYCSKHHRLSKSLSELFMPFSLKDPRGGKKKTLFQIAAVRDGHQHSSGQGGMSFTNMKVRTSKDKVPLPLSPLFLPECGWKIQRC